MGLFDKLKPKYKNSDSEIRKEGVLELAADKKNILKNQKILNDLARNDPSSQVRMAAIENVVGEGSVCYAALNDPDSKVRNVAVKRLDDFIDGSLYNYLIPSSDGTYEVISNKEILENIAVNDSSEDVRQSANKILEKYNNINFGTYHNSIERANEYWTIRRFGWKNKPQFTLFKFDDAVNAETALLEMPFIHKNSITGELICDRMMEYGFYEAESGTYEAIIGGFDLTLDEYNKAEDSFRKYGGELKTHQEPNPTVKACNVADGNSLNVKYKETVKNSYGSVYEVYEAPKPEDAMMFLGSKTVTQNSYFIVVETPKGSFARDIIGIYQEIYI